MRTAGALLVLLALTIGVYWKLTLSDLYTWLENPDHSLLLRPWLDYEAREVHAGRLPLWDPYHYGGQSLVAQLEPGVFNPFNWPLFLWPLKDGHVTIGALHWYWVLIHFVAAAFLYWLCRDLGCGVGSSLVGATVYGFIGYVGQSGTTVFLMSCIWVPVALLFLARVFRGERVVANGAACGAALGAGFLTGHHNIPIYLVVIVGVCWVARLAPRLRDRRLWLAAFACLAIWLMVGAVQSLPTIEYGKQALRWVGTPEPLHWKDPVPYSVHAEYSLQMKSVPGLLAPGLTVHANPFVGIVALSLAIAAVVWRRKEVSVRLLAGVAIGAFVLALGKDTPVHWVVYKIVPMVEKARYPAMCIAIFQCAVAALAAMGLALPVKTLRRMVVPLALAGVAGLALLWRLHMPADYPAWIVAMVALGMAAAMWRRWWPAVLALALVEVAADPRPILRPKDVPDSYTKLIASHADIAAFLKAQPGWFRVEVDDEAVPYNFGDFYGIEQFGGYVPGMPERVHRVLGHPETARQYGIAYRVGKKPSNEAQAQVFASSSGLKVYRDPRIGEPVWAEHEGPCTAPDRFAVVSRTPESSEFEVELGCAGRVLIGDPYYRGWRAWVDGRRAPIEEADGGIRAVRAGAGRHRIVFRYRPASVMWGAGLTTLGLVMLVTLRRCRGPKGWLD
jgi:hypothetical protein